jgi:hypothetical protein
MRYILILSTLISCARNPADIGKVEISYSFECVKTTTNVGFSTSGNVHFTGQCTVTKCFRREYILGEYIGTQRLISRKLVDDSFCVDN